MKLKFITTLLALLITVPAYAAAEQGDTQTGSLLSAIQGLSKAVEGVKSMFDWRPFDGTFLMSAGYMTQPIGKQDSTNTVSTQNALASSRHNTKIDTGPYLGLGWSGVNSEQRLSVSVDIGVVYQGLELPGDDRLNSINYQNPSQQPFESLRAESEWSPVAHLGVNYRF